MGFFSPKSTRYNPPNQAGFIWSQLVCIRSSSSRYHLPCIVNIFQLGFIDVLAPTVAGRSAEPRTPLHSVCRTCFSFKNKPRESTQCIICIVHIYMISGKSRFGDVLSANLLLSVGLARSTQPKHFVCRRFRSPIQHLAPKQARLQ